MSLRTEGNKKIIECDKCHKTSEAGLDDYNEIFSNENWVLNKGRKYEHLCCNCLSRAKLRAVLFVKKNFLNKK